MTLLGPGIGKQNERTPIEAVGQPAQQRAGIVGMQADVGERLAPRWRSSTLSTPSSNGSQPISPTSGLRAPARPDARPRQSRSRARPRATGGANRSAEAGAGCARSSATRGSTSRQQRLLPRARLASAPAPVAAQILPRMIVARHGPLPTSPARRAQGHSTATAPIAPIAHGRAARRRQPTCLVPGGKSKALRSVRDLPNLSSRQGDSPPGAPRTVHDPLESHGSRCSARCHDITSNGRRVRVGPA